MLKYCEYCGNAYSKPYYNSKKVWEERKFCSMSCSLQVTGIKKGEPLPDSWKANMKGKNTVPPGLSGDNHYNWKGGPVSLTCQNCNEMFQVKPYRANTAKYCSRACKIQAQDRNISSENEKFRKSKAYKEWRKAVFLRDNYTCQICGIRGGQLHADHIEQFAYNYDLRLDIDNGRTLCASCHRKTPTYARKVVAYRKGY